MCFIRPKRALTPKQQLIIEQAKAEHSSVSVQLFLEKHVRCFMCVAVSMFNHFFQFCSVAVATVSASLAVSVEICCFDYSNCCSKYIV